MKICRILSWPIAVLATVIFCAAGLVGMYVIARLLLIMLRAIESAMTIVFGFHPWRQWTWYAFIALVFGVLILVLVSSFQYELQRWCELRRGGRQ